MAERVILCGPVSSQRLPTEDRRPLRLALWGAEQNIRFQYEQMRRWMCGDAPSLFRDLIDIASYVYVADQAIRRGNGTDQDLGKSWRRRLFFRIPVRRPDFWAKSSIRTMLVRALSFLSEDEYHFQFERLAEEPPFPGYFNFTEADDAGDVEEVMLFSGGLDSLGGAVREAVLDRRRVLLVHHRSASKRIPRFQRLMEGLQRHSRGAMPWQISIWLDKAKKFDLEFTQRSRSFLYASLAATLAVMVGRRRLRFYENGVVSINLPPSPQVVGARATRTTHPQTLCNLERLFSALLDGTFRVENPFLWETKADVVQRIASAGCADLIRDTISCTRIWEMTRQHIHCGACSQCIDRRFAVLACGLQDEDPAKAYGVDLLTGAREEGNPRTMLAVYLETANQLSRMGIGTFFSRYGEATRILRHTGESPDGVALKIYQLYQRHAAQVNEVVDRGLAEYAAAVRQRSLPESCLIRLVTDPRGGEAERQESEPADMDHRSPLPANIFRRRERVWQVRFAGGREFVLLPSKGASYLHLLLSNSGRVFSVAELASTVSKSPRQYALGSAGETIDREALSAYRARLVELNEEIAEAQKDHDVASQTRLEQEREEILEQVRRAVGRGGRLRKASDDRNRVRVSVRAAIRRAITEIGKYDAPLAQHLSGDCLCCGWNPCYRPDPTIGWET